MASSKLECLLKALSPSTITLGVKILTQEHQNRDKHLLHNQQCYPGFFLTETSVQEQLVGLCAQDHIWEAGGGI